MQSDASSSSSRFTAAGVALLPPSGCKQYLDPNSLNVNVVCSNNALISCTDNERHNYMDFIRKNNFNLTKTCILSKLKMKK